jgi:hypothetical protein
MKFEKKINIYFTVTELAEYMYYLLKYISTRLKKKELILKLLVQNFQKKDTGF